MTSPGTRWISILAIAAHGAALTALPFRDATAAAVRAHAPRAADSGSNAPLTRASATVRPLIDLAPIPFPSPVPDPLRLDATLMLRAEDPSGEDAAGPTPQTEAILGERRPLIAPAWWVWTGSAALVGLFVAGFAHDLKKESGPPPEVPDLPDFPDTP